MSKSKTDHNNDGQGDGANDNLDPPHSAGDEFAAFCGVYHRSFEEVHEDNRAYGTGHDNGSR
ncbi:hypothetical protein [Hydrogenophaga sp.]|jgi:hypothetical protein|uniref:hypothetical protein n=1 Tax=Hydrogenophaga sp. TaxID=1904254 RepID=UPI003F6F2787